MLTELRLPKILTEQFGLAPAHLRDLGRVVILAGPNGAGKSRYLRLIATILNEQAGSSESVKSNAAEAGRNRVNAAATQDEKRKAEFLSQENVFTHQSDRARATIDALSSEAHAAFANRTEKVAIISHPARWTPPPVTRVPVATPDPMQLQEATAQLGFDNAYRAIDVYAASIARAMFNANVADFKDQLGVPDAAQRAKVFNEILNTLTGRVFEPQIDSKTHHILPTFGKRRLVANQLSEGERILIAWAIVLYQQGTDLRRAILLIDEPENSLHPDACIRALRGLEATAELGSGQIWLATHSLPLIASFSLSSVYLVADGQIHFAGNRITDIGTRLLGGEENKERLRRLLSDIDDISYHEFAAQCLLSPTVAAHREGDKQESLVCGRIDEWLTSLGDLSILDFGAGRGRMSLALEGQIRSKPIAGRLTYVAYNRSTETAEVHAECAKSVRSLQGVPNVHVDYIQDIRLAQSPASQLFDVILLSNVLHEASPFEWRPLFRDITPLHEGWRSTSCA